LSLKEYAKGEEFIRRRFAEKPLTFHIPVYILSLSEGGIVVTIKTHILQEDATAELVQNITVNKTPSATHSRLEERLVVFYGKQVEEIGRIQDDREINWGSAMGHEVW